MKNLKKSINNKEKERKNTINNSINKINSYNNKGENKNENEKKSEDIFLTEPDANKFRKRTIPVKGVSPTKALKRRKTKRKRKRRPSEKIKFNFRAIENDARRK